MSVSPQEPNGKALDDMIDQLAAGTYEPDASTPAWVSEGLADDAAMKLTTAKPRRVQGKGGVVRG